VTLMSDRVKWCCAGFEAAYQAGGSRTIAAVVDRYSDGRPAFLLQSRTFDSGYEPPALNSSVPMTLITEAGMSFCPWCGNNLAKWYRKSVDTLARPGLRIDQGI
jgi:hypothetical protein